MKEKPYTGIDLTGRRFERLTVIRFYGFKRSPLRPGSRLALWECRCDCGKMWIGDTGRLTSGNTRSCGCLHIEGLIAIATKHGHKPQNGKIHPLYFRWYGMIQRCTQPKNKAYHWYGERGIKVCERWRHFELFLEDMEATFVPGLTIDRKNVDGDYCPENCEWVTWEQQCRNKRKRQAKK